MEVDNAVGGQLDDASRQRGDEFAVVADKQQRTRVVLQRQVERLDRFHIQVVGRLVQQHDVGLLQDQLAEQHSTLLATGDHLDRLVDLLLREQHATQSTADHLLVIALLPPLAHPVIQVHVTLEILSMILSVVADFGIFRPFHRTGIGFQITDQALEQGRLADAVGTDDGDTLAHIDLQVEAGEQLLVERLGQPFHLQRGTVQLFCLLEADKRVLTAGRLDLFQLDLVDLFQPRGRLARLGGVGGETADK